MCLLTCSWLSCLNSATLVMLWLPPIVFLLPRLVLKNKMREDMVMHATLAYCFQGGDMHIQLLPKEKGKAIAEIPFFSEA